ncbi:cilia- and flagella-associated protein 58-like isoform X2 [Notolabrus celidotus]|uniref:cilia- and flagella-associated protein 58-like isoform X2 n=1 Tax=Notolabrus celidotus TaxID=1203425 RepID=UPI0014905D3A|nr:cilia- and flagella-associated protein 58-like isoform X2 [Notolabrus celidotus]
MPKQSQKTTKAAKRKPRHQEEPVDVSTLHLDLKKHDEVLNAEREISPKKKNKRPILTEELKNEKEFTARNPQDQGDQEEPCNSTGDETPVLDAELIESIKRMPKKLLQEEYLELMKDYIITKGKLEAFDADIQGQQVIVNLTAERDTLKKKMKEINIQKGEAIKKQEKLLEEVDELKQKLSPQECPSQENPVLKNTLKNIQEEFKNKLIQEVQGTLRVSNQEFSETYQTEVATFRHQAEILNSELEREVQANADRMVEDQQFIKNLQVELNAQHREMAETNISLQNTLDKEKDHMREIEELRIQLNSHKQLLKEHEELKEEQKTTKEKFDAELQLEKQKYMLLQKEHKSHKAMDDQQDQMNLTAEKEDLIKSMSEKEEEDREITEAVKLQEGPEDSEITSAETSESSATTLTPQEEPQDLTGVTEIAPQVKPSSWKRFRHFIGLRKPKSWKKKKKKKEPTITPQPHPSDP